MRESVEHRAHDRVGQKAAAVGEYQPTCFDFQQAVVDGDLGSFALSITEGADGKASSQP